MLIDDIAALSHIFSHVMDASYLRVRLDVVTTNACRKFHVDAVTTRLICTYRGPGTQYGSASDGQEPRHIFTVPTCAPVMLRGSLAPGHSSPQILHRSPPIDGTAMSRLVLVLDPVEDEDDVADMPPSITRH